MYVFLSWVFGLALDLYYRRLPAVGRVPADGPVIIVANHPNALLDPIVVTRIAGRRVRFLGKEPLFRTPVLKYLVKGMGALPVYRAQDGHDTAKNEEMFRAVYSALGDGEVVCLFPEGISHNIPRLQPLKTGAARMAFGAEAANDFSLDLKVVPIGLIYRDKRTFRSDVATFIGEPIDVAANSDATDDEVRDDARKLTDAINDGIRSLTVNMDEWEDWPLLEVAERVFVDDNAEDATEEGPANNLRSKTSRMARIANGKDELRAIAPLRVDALQARVAEVLDRFQKLGLQPRHVGQKYSPSGVFTFLLRNFFALVLGLPFAAVGLVAYGIPFLFLKFVPRLLTDELDMFATYRMLSAILLFPLWHGGLCVLLQTFMAVDLALWVGLVLPFAGLYAHHFWRRRRAAVRDARIFLTLGVSQRLRKELDDEMAVIGTEISSLYELLQKYREAALQSASDDESSAVGEGTA